MTAHSGDTDQWIRRYHPAPDSEVRLLCLPHAGGSASFYFPVSQALAPRVEVLSVQYPGRQDRRLEPCVESIPELADHLLPLVLDGFTDRPLAVFGHSMGASLAFELAGLLEQAGVAPVMVFASGRRAPSRFRVEEDVHTRGDEALLDEIKRLAGTDTRVLGDDEVLRMVLPAIRSDYRAAELYRPQRIRRLSCPVTAVVGDSDPKAPLDDVRAWQEHTTGEFSMEVYPGGHFYLTDQAPRLIQRIADTLSGAAADR
ncbi:thioesterase II family protein [Streptomyces graminilatus]|uniref:thioesterase II family protein n=1 Tax=Streptomyces graminilatus TaxID=1464070 RepID=UPI0006E2CD69|nr:alpha/beta fold hydrolase [Streptomyces graminilatus]